MIIKMLDYPAIERARDFAAIKHAGQQRKHTGEPYIVHPERVANIVADHPLCSTDEIVAAFLHDTVEDCDCTEREIFDSFGRKVAMYVRQLTKAKGIKKDVYYADLYNCSRLTCIIKLADRLDNVTGLDKCPADFQRYYRKDTRILLPYIQWADKDMAKLIEEKIESL
jgi:guanosine-3',5'-bis(diphosphate) 3'-pyrophosphohydrolase